MFRFSTSIPYRETVDASFASQLNYDRRIRNAAGLFDGRSIAIWLPAIAWLSNGRLRL
jgi:hypothetical protein